jgi:hypothetical protein
MDQLLQRHIPDDKTGRNEQRGKRDYSKPAYSVVALKSVVSEKKRMSVLQQSKWLIK